MFWLTGQWVLVFDAKGSFIKCELKTINESVITIQLEAMKSKAVGKWKKSWENKKESRRSSDEDANPENVRKEPK